MGASSLLPIAAGTAGLDLLGANKAGKANQANLNLIKQLFYGSGGAVPHGQELYGQALAGLDNAGVAAKNDALSQEKQQLAGSTQQLADLGLGSSTVGNAASRGIHSDTMRNLGNIDNQIAIMRANLLTGQAGFGLQGAQGLGSILSGVQHNYSPITPGILGLGFGMFGNQGNKG